MRWNDRIRAALEQSGQAPDDDVIEELAQHAQATYDAARADGLSSFEAERQVADQVERWQREVAALRRRSRRPPAVEPPRAGGSTPFAGFVQDVRYAARLLGRQSRFTLLASVTMALGIGATTTLFSITYGVLVKPLPWPGGDRLVQLTETRGGTPPRFGSFTNAAFLAWRDHASTIDGLAAWSQGTVTMSGAGDADRIRVTDATASLFRVLDVHPLFGSLFTETDEIDQPAVVVLSEGLWRQRFGADRQALGRIVRFDGQPFVVVGVVADAAGFPDRRTRAWVPFRVHSAEGNYLSMFNAVARVRPGVTAAQAASEGTARGRFAADTRMTTIAIFGGNGPIAVSAVPLKDALTADVRQPLVVLLAAVVLLLVTATANVAGLHLARAVGRRREMAIRAALGAGTARIVRQLFVESVLLGLTGGAAGILLAWLFHRLIPAVLPVDFPRLDDVSIDATVMVFAFVVSIAASIVFGLLPAVRTRRANLVTLLSEDGTAPVGATRATRVGRARMIIMAGQVAIACVLLVGASLLGRSFLALLHADRGYDPSGILTARVSLPGSMYSAERRYAIVRGILDRLASLPAVTDAAFTSELPLTAGGSTSAFTLRRPGGTVTAQASPRMVSTRVFSVLGMRILSGRGFSETDTEASPPVVVVNRAFARRYLDDRALGAKLPMGDGYQQDDVEATVVGVVDDVRYLTGSNASQPELYYSYRQFAGRVTVPVVTFLVRTTGKPGGLAANLRTTVREADNTLAPDAIATMEDRVLTVLARPRLYTILLGGFAGFALVVAAVGLFAVLSQAVTERSREIAVRSALGARPSDLLRMIAGQGLAIASVGLIVGLGISTVLVRSMSTFLYGVTPYDRLTFIVVPLLLLAVAAIACLVPARRAMRTDPVQVLRSN